MRGNSCSIQVWFRMEGSEVVSKTDQLVGAVQQSIAVGDDGGDDDDGYRRSCTRRRWAGGGRCW